MAEIVSGLFGIDPVALQANRQALDEANAFKFANLTGGEQAQYGAALAGRQLGRAVPAMFGIEDPMLAKANLAKRLSSQFDITSESGLRQYAQALAQNGAPDLAQMAIKRADELRTTGLTQAEKISQITKNVRESIKQVGLTTEGQQVYQSGDEQYILGENGKRIPYYGRLESKTPKTEVKVTTGQKNVLAIDQKDAEDILKQRNSLEKSIPLLENSVAQLNRGIIGGTFSDARTALATGLTSIGIKDPNITKYLANTKTFNANRIELATAIAKQLGVNPTDRDFQASLDRFASASESPAASKIFLTEMLALKRQQLDDANNALNYFRKNEGSFAGYDRPLPRAFSSTGNELSSMTDEQLRQEINKRKNTQKK